MEQGQPRDWHSIDIHNYIIVLVGISWMPTFGRLTSMGRVLSAVTDQTNEVSKRTPSESMQHAGSVTHIHTCYLSNCPSDLLRVVRKGW